MEEANDEECIAKLFGFKGNNKNKKANKKKTKKKAGIQIVTVEAKAEDSARASNDDGDAASTNRVRISEFDFSVDNFFRDMDTIARLCGEEDAVDFDQSEIQRISSSVTFLREWREFKYPPRSIRFGYGHGSSEGKDVSAINLPQFSSATVPMYDMQKEDHLGDAKSQESRDFVMHVGGPVWALDWCPQIHEKPDCSIKCEFIAVAAHPPGSSYHKMGAPLTGRGVIQIWCLLNIREHNEEVCSLTEKRKKRPKKGGDTNVKSTQIKRPRGRPRKNPIEVPVDDMNCETHNVPALDVQFPEDSTEFPTPDGNLEKNQEIFPTTNKRKRGPKKNEATNEKSGQIKRPRGRPKKNSKEIIVVGTNCENQALSVQVPEDSTEFISPDVTHGNIALQENSVTEQKHGKKAASACNTSSKNEATNEKSGQIKRPRGRPKKNSKEVIAVDTNYDNQAVQALAVKVPEDSAEFMSPDVAHGNIAMQQNSVTKQKHAKKVASACNTSSKNEATNEKSGQIKKPRGKPKKNSKEIIAVETNCENQAVQALAVQVPEDSVEFISPNVAHGNIASQQNSVKKQTHAKKAAFACNTSSKTPIKISRLKVKRRSYSQDINEPLLTHCENEANHQPHINQPLLTHCEHEANHQPHCSSELGRLAATHSIPGQLTLPRVVSCLAHNGKVAWDVKWRPPNMSDSLCKHRMGYLAVLLGNGSLEVWEVPLPRVLRAIYMHKEGNDPRFIKLEPVFKCSMLKRGGLQSIPLTVEWSVTPPHDYLLAGCHDGTVALWKFSTNASSKCDDTKPVLCFSGDTVPIRAVAWAPFDGDPESSNIIVTAGHEGLKFWDLRNPFHPLRNLHPAPRIIYSLDWLSKPSCIIMSFEDGTMRTISLVKAANDLPFSGKTYTGKKQPGLHSSSYSSFAIWSVQVSRITGMVAYCGADGTVFRFQLTSKAVEKDDSRNRAPYFLCGSVTEKESTLIINTPVSNAPFPLRKSYERARHAQSFRELLSKSNISKNANNQMAKASNSDSQTLALCDGDDLGLESESEEALSSVEQPKRPNLTHSNSKKPVESQTLVCRDDVSTSTLVVDNEKSNFGNIPEVFPSKMVALHRVRWNMNKGSERWLCFGGAGGIVRCQEIVFSNIDKKWALKR